MLFSRKTNRTSASGAIIAALDRTHALVWLDNFGKILKSNKNFQDIFGYEAGELKDQPYTMLAVDRTLDQTFWMERENGSPVSGEFAHRHKDGSAVYLDVSFTHVGDGVMAIAKDVTARKIAAIEAEQFVEAITSSQSIVEYDLNGHFLRANDRFLETARCNFRDIVGSHRNTFIADTEADTAFWSDVISGKTRETVSQRRMADGSTQALKEVFCVLDQAKGRKVVSIVADVTDAVVESDDPEMRGFSESIAALELCADGKIVFATEKFLAMTDYQSDEVVRNAYSSLFDVSYDLAAGFDDTLGKALSSILPIKKKSGETCWYRNDISVAEGSYAIAVSDVTDWKRESDALSSAITKLADGDLAARLPEPSAKEWQKSHSAFNALADKLQTLLSETVDLSALILEESGAIANGSQLLSERCEQQAASVEETSSSMDEMSSSVRSSAQSAKDATDAATSAADFAQKGQRIVDDAIAAMNKIEEGSVEVRKIIEVIDVIAFQTNLLALNAGVEAARAGEAGRGFAVVASEVRALAQRASDSARDISALIESSGTQVKEGAALVNETGNALNEIVDAVAQVSTGIEGVFAASTEQSEGVGEITQAILNIDSTTQKTAAISEESTASAKLLVEKAKGLQDLIQYFRIGDQQKHQASPGKVTTIEEPKSLLEETAQQAAPKPAKAPPPPATNGALALQSNDDDGWDEF